MCLVPLLLGICVADPANLTIHADTSVQIAGSFTYNVDHKSYGSGHVARLGLDMAAPLTERWTIHYGVEHTSLLDTQGDRGQERIYLAIEFRPFR